MLDPVSVRLQHIVERLDQRVSLGFNVDKDLLRLVQLTTELALNISNAQQSLIVMLADLDKRIRALEEK